MERVAYIHKHSGHASLFLKNGKQITFTQRLYSTTNPDEIAGLDEHTEYGRCFQRLQTKEDLDRLAAAQTSYTKGPATTVRGMDKPISQMLPPKKTEPETITVIPKKGKYRG